MTAYCGGGPSGPLPGAPEAVVVDAAIIESTLILAGLPEVAAALAPFLVQSPFILNDFCAADPPADPGLTLLDVLDAIDVHSVTQLTSIIKAQQWFARYEWFKWCGCTSVTTPTPPPLSKPGPGLGTGTGLPTASPAVPCWNVNILPILLPASPGTPSRGTDLTRTGLPAGDQANTVPPNSSAPNYAIRIPSGAQQMKLTGTINKPATGGQRTFVGWDIFNAGGSTVLNGLTVQWISGASGTVSQTLPTLPTGATWWNLYAGTTEFATDYSIDLEVSFYCGSPTALTTPCCPPDQLVSYSLTNILNLVLDIRNSIGGGGNAPIGWHDGQSHTGLSGAGSFPLTNPAAVAVRVNMTKLPTGVQVAPGNPTFYWDAGFITPYVATSPLRGQRLVFASETMQLPAFTDQIGYTLLHGTEVTITELLPTLP